MCPAAESLNSVSNGPGRRLGAGARRWAQKSRAPAHHRRHVNDRRRCCVLTDGHQPRAVGVLRRHSTRPGRTPWGTAPDVGDRACSPACWWRWWWRPGAWAAGSTRASRSSPARSSPGCPPRRAPGPPGPTAPPASPSSSRTSATRSASPSDYWAAQFKASGQRFQPIRRVVSYTAGGGGLLRRAAAAAQQRRLLLGRATSSPTTSTGRWGRSGRSATRSCSTCSATSTPTASRSGSASATTSPSSRSCRPTAWPARTSATRCARRPLTLARRRPGRVPGGAARGRRRPGPAVVRRGLARHRRAAHRLVLPRLREVPGRLRPGLTAAMPQVTPGRRDARRARAG